MLELFKVFATNQAAIVSPDGEQLLHIVGNPSDFHHSILLTYF